MNRTLRRALITAVAAIGLAGIGAAPAMATPASSTPSQCGVAHAASADLYGNYGGIGEVHGAPNLHGGATGQDLYATGYNNSHTDCQA